MSHAIDAESARVCGSSRNGLQGSYHGHKRRDELGRLITGAVTRLPVRIPSPAVRDTGPGQCAGVVATGADRGEPFGGRHGHGECAVFLCAISQLADQVAAPAIDFANVSEPAGVGPSIADPLEPQWSIHVGGDLTRYDTVPSPSCPAAFAPQQIAAP